MRVVNLWGGQLALGDAYPQATEGSVNFVKRFALDFPLV